MKPLSLAVFFIAFFTLAIHANSHLPKKIAGGRPVSSPHVTFDKQWADYDVFDGGVKGMRIHLKFTIDEMKQRDAYVAIFYTDDYGNRLRDKNQKYYSSGGDVALYFKFTPCCDATDYNDMQLFMPYDEFDLPGGKYNLTMDVEIIYPDGTLIQHLNYYDFLFTQPGSTTTNTDNTNTNTNNTRTSESKNASFDKMWVDYDITENGVKGMLIHVKFGMTNMKDVDCYLVAFFSTKTGRKLTSTNQEYSSKDGLGQLALYKHLNPGYNEAAYKDAQMFLPYSQINLSQGKWDLTLDLDLIYPSGDVIKHLQYYDFWFNKP